MANPSLQCSQRRYLQVVIWLARDLRPLPDHDRGILSSITSCIKLVSAVPKRGTFSQTVSFPGAFNDNVPGSYNPKRIHPKSSLHFPGPLLSNLALTVDVTVASCRVVVTMRDLITINHRESRISRNASERTSASERPPSRAVIDILFFSCSSLFSVLRRRSYCLALDTTHPSSRDTRHNVATTRQPYAPYFRLSFM